MALPPRKVPHTSVLMGAAGLALTDLVDLWAALAPSPGSSAAA
jgi:hypothetical protein